MWRNNNLKHLQVKKVRNGWIVVNNKTNNHAHFKSSYGCYLIIKFLSHGLYPKNNYLQESYDRLKDEEKTKKKQKQKYINQNMGI